jgi:sulfite reductase alpha subunit-like flavoprotein
VVYAQPLEAMSKDSHESTPNSLNSKVQENEADGNKHSEHSGHSYSLTETESDEFQDNHSVISEDHSVSMFSNLSWNQFNAANQKITPQAVEKLLHSMKKLKKENASLKEMLEHAKVNDITLLRTKLRGANADILRFKQVNTELKERIQSLEAKLFHLLSESDVPPLENSQNEERKSIFSEISEKFKQMKETKQQNVPSSSSSSNQVKNGSSNTSNPSINYPIQYDKSTVQTIVNNEESEPISKQTLLSKCKHYEKLIKVYEKNLSVMQVNCLYNLSFLPKYILSKSCCFIRMKSID